MTLTRSKSSTEKSGDFADHLTVVGNGSGEDDSASEYVLSDEECGQVTTDEESDIDISDDPDSDCEITKVVTSDEKAVKIDLVEEEEEEEKEEEDETLAWYKEWGELDEWEKIAVDSLGFTEETWSSENIYMDDFTREWEDITEGEKGYLLVLGMDEKNWNLYLDLLDEGDDEEYRMDPYDKEYYTYGAFVEWYGCDHIWKRMETKMVLYRHALKDTYDFANTLSPTLQKGFIDKMMMTF